MKFHLVYHLTKEYYEEFKSHPRHWIDMDPRFRKELEHYLNSPVPETSEEPFSDKTTSSENCDTLSSTSSCFESKDDLTSYSPSDKIKRDSSSSSETFQFSNL